MRLRDREEHRRQGRSGPEALNPDTTAICRRPRRLAVLVVVAAVGLGACTGGSSSPHVAGLGTSSGKSGTRSANNSSEDAGGRAGTASAAPAGNPTVLLDEWASCMRSHGDPDQVDPTITANKVIDITWNPDIPGGIYGTDKGGQGDLGPGQYCRGYLSAAQAALRGGQSEKQPDPAQLEKYSECMRADGVPDFPDPGPGGSLSISLSAGGDLNPNSPTFQDAAKLCARTTGVPGFASAGTPQPGMIELNGALPGGAGG